MFEYDPANPLNLETKYTVTVKDIAYTVQDKRIGAYLVLPENSAPSPAILYVHWYESHAATSNRTQFLGEAIQLAQDSGIVSLLVETIWSNPRWYWEGRSLETDYDDTCYQMIALRRALDVLEAQPQVNRQRIAYVGHDFGAMYGALIAAVDRRPKAYVLIAGASDFNKWMLYNVQDDHPGLDHYKEKMAALAPSKFIAQAAAPILFQFGDDDFYTPQEDIDAFYNAAVDPKILKIYPGGHAMIAPAIQTDRIAFLKEHLFAKT